MDDLEQQILSVLRGSAEGMTPVAVADRLETTYAVADVAIALDRLVEAGEAAVAAPPADDPVVGTATYYTAAARQSED